MSKRFVPVLSSWTDASCRCGRCADCLARKELRALLAVVKEARLDESAAHHPSQGRVCKLCKALDKLEKVNK